MKFLMTKADNDKRFSLSNSHKALTLSKKFNILHRITIS